MTDHRARLLLVDDIPANLIALEAVLQSTKYELFQATSGEEALKLLEDHDFALILLDIQMPGIDGFETARRIKQNERTRHVPIIFITAIHTEDPYVRKGYEAGAVDFFGKPFDPEILRLKVGIYTEIYEKNYRLKSTVQDAERRAAELNTVLESIPDAVYVGDENGITRCNEAALALFGMDADQALGKNFAQLAAELDIRNVRTGEKLSPEEHSFYHALKGEAHVSTVKMRHLKTGEDRLIGLAAAPVIYENKIIGVVVVNTDFTVSYKAA